MFLTPLVRLGESAALRGRPADSNSVTVPLVLAHGLEVTPVPPGSLRESAGRYCVTSGGAAHSVELVGSELGRALVTAKSPLTSVDVPADPNVPCE